MSQILLRRVEVWSDSNRLRVRRAGRLACMPPNRFAFQNADPRSAGWFNRRWRVERFGGINWRSGYRGRRGDRSCRRMRFRLVRGDMVVVFKVFQEVTDVQKSVGVAAD